MWKPGLMALLCTLACNPQAPRASVSTQAPPITGVASVEPAGGQLPDGVTPLSYALELEIVPSRKEFTGRARIELQIERPIERILLHAANMSFGKIALWLPGEKVPLPLEPSPGSVKDLVTLTLREPLEPTRATLEIVYSAWFDEHLHGLYRVESGGLAYAFTQFEPIHARQAFPGFDEPRFKTPFDVTLRVPSDAVAISNTRVHAERPLGNGLREVTFARTEKLPTYLVAFAVGPLAVVDAGVLPPSAARKQPLPLRGVAPRGRGADLRFALSETPALIDSLETYFGIGYPYDKLDLIAVPDFGAGAMENAGAITFRDTLLLVGERAPEWQRRAVVSVDAHELAHQWFGNLVTMAWWDDLWLNEGFATWLASKVVEDVHPEYKPEIQRVLGVDRAMNNDSRQSARQIRQPILSDHDIKNAFDSITYVKGGAVLGMFERYLGEAAFRAGLQLYLTRHRFGTGTAKDLLQSLEEAARVPVAAAFSSFLDQPGVPLVSATLECDPSHAPRLHLEQRRYVPLGSKLADTHKWQVPVCVSYALTPSPIWVGPSSSPSTSEASREQCTLLDEPAQDLVLETESCPAWIFPNARALGYYRWSLAESDFASLVQRGYGDLRPSERLSLLSNADAAARAGAVSSERVIELAARLGKERERESIEASLRVLSRLEHDLLTPNELPAYRQLVRSLLGVRARELGLFESSGSEDPETKLLRATVIDVLAFDARDTDLRKQLDRLGRALLGFEPDPDALRLPSELVPSAMAVAVQNGGSAVLERAIAQLSTTNDGIERSRLLHAIGSNLDPSLSLSVLELSLGDVLRNNERAAPLFDQAQQRETKDITYQWVRDHFDALVTRMGKENAGVLVQIVSEFCSEEVAAEARQFYGPRIEALSGGPRMLDQAVEQVQLCAAFARSQGEAARRVFSR
jgi:alanyl aminopeptidase